MKLRNLDLSEYSKQIKHFKKHQVQSIAICLFTSYANPKQIEDWRTTALIDSAKVKNTNYFQM